MNLVPRPPPARVAVLAASALTAAGLAAAGLAGCAQPSSPSTTPATSIDGSSAGGPAASSRSSTGLPTLTAPTAPPRTPTDNVPKDAVSGRLTAVSAPCFRLTTDDGTAYALYGTDVGPVAVGDVVRVKVAELTTKINCGPGRAARIVALSVVG